MLRQFFREAVAVQGRRDPVADRSASWVGPAGPEQVVADGETVLERDHAGAVDLAQHRDEHLGGRDHDLVARLQGQVAVQAVAVPQRGRIELDALAGAHDVAVRGAPNGVGPPTAYRAS